MSDHSQNCLFCKIADGQIPAFKVWEDDKHIAFLSIHPLKPGHTLVIPKKHLPYVFQIDDEELSELIKASKKVANKLEQVYHPKTGKIGIVVYGLDIDHTHIHLVPIDQSGDLDFAKAKRATQSELSTEHTKIHAK